MLIISKPVFNGYKTKWKKIAEVRVLDVFDMNIIINEIYNNSILKFIDFFFHV